MARYPEKYVLHSALSPDQAVEALRQSMNDDRDTHTSLNGGKRPVIGIIEGYRFRIYRRSGFLEDHAGDFRGTMFPERTGTSIEGDFVKGDYKFIHSLLLKRRTVGHAKLSTALMSLLFVFVISQPVFNPEIPWVNIPVILVSCLVLLSVIELNFMLWRRRRGRQFLLGHLQRVLHATLDLTSASH